MKDRLWKCLIFFALIGLIVWMRIDRAEMDERYRILTDRQDRVERLTEQLPAMMDRALALHRQALIACLEGSTDDRQEGD